MEHPEHLIFDLQYKGTAPCPGCGKPGTERPRHRKNTLCPTCYQELEYGRACKKASEEFAILVVPGWDCFNFSKSNGKTLRWQKNPERDILNKLLRDLLRLIQNVYPSPEKRPKHYEYVMDAKKIPKIATTTEGEELDLGYQTGTSFGSQNVERLFLPRSIAQALADFLHATRKSYKEMFDNYAEWKDHEPILRQEYFDKVYNEGVEKGRNLLSLLNNEQITPSQFLEPIKYRKEES